MNKNIFTINLEENFLFGDKKYFITFLDDRFLSVNLKLKKILENRYGVEFEPIYVFGYAKNKIFNVNNSIVLNKRINDIDENSYYDYINLEFSKNLNISSLIKKILKKQDNIFLISFNSFNLDIKNKNVIKIVGEQFVSDFLDDKINQIKIFDQNLIKHPKSYVFNSFSDVLDFKKINYPFFVSAKNSSCGAGNAVINKYSDLMDFYKKIDPKLRKDKFFISKYINDVIISPSSHAIVCGLNDVRVLSITDQIISNGNVFDGNIYPSRISLKNSKKIQKVMLKIGKYISKIGFKGFFGCDFIIDSKDNLYIIEINPRRTAPYLNILSMYKKIDLLDIELSIFLGEKIENFNYNEIQPNICWAHKKIKSYTGFAITKKEVKKNTEEKPFSDIGSEFYCTYFEKDKLLNSHIFGYYITTGTDYDEVLERTNRRTKILKKQLIEEINPKDLKKNKK